MKEKDKASNGCAIILIILAIIVACFDYCRTEKQKDNYSETKIQLDERIRPHKIKIQ